MLARYLQFFMSRASAFSPAYPWLHDAIVASAAGLASGFVAGVAAGVAAAVAAFIASHVTRDRSK